jgi:hypothetical protein
MNKKLVYGGILIAVVIAIGGLYYPTVDLSGLKAAVENSLGASGTRFPNGLSADSTSPVAGQVRGTTLTSTGAATFGTAAIGSSGTTLTQVNAGTCYIAPYAATIAASSTALVECQATAGWDAADISTLTGVASGDAVQVILSTTTAGSTFLGLNLAGATASNTPGYIQLRLFNQTGTTFTWPTSGSASGTASYISIN